MALSDSFLQELISRNDIEDVASSYVRLKKRGRTSVGLCPFHAEKTPSFTIYPETTSFYCFGCGAGGDVITFIRRIENLGYIDAIKFLSDRAGLKMPDDNVDDSVSKLRTRVLEANRAAARLFHQNLYTNNGKKGLDYYYSRGFTESTIKKFGLGYAYDDFYSVTNTMRKMGFTDDELTAAFLSARSRKNKTQIYDIFRNRVMIPIIDVRGSVVGFGGRILDETHPKYINTSDTLVFDKSNTLFSLNFAKTSKSNFLILCEGYMDVIALSQAGFDNSVAALGTAFTPEHARLIARYTEEIVLVFDPDEAGRKGTKRAIDYLRKTGVRIRIVSIPDGLDPDDYIKKNGAERFNLLINQSANDVEFRLSDLERHFDLYSSEGKVNYLKKASELLASLPSPIERDVYAGRLSQQLSVSKDSILAQTEGIVKQNYKQRQKRQLSYAVQKSEENSNKANPQSNDFTKAAKAEESMLGMIITNPDLISCAINIIKPEDIVTDFNRRLYSHLIRRNKKGLLIEMALLSDEYDTDEMDYIANIVQQARGGNATDESIKDCARIIKEERKKQSLGKPENLSDEDILSMMNKLRQKKSKNESEDKV